MVGSGGNPTIVSVLMVRQEARCVECLLGVVGS